MCRQNYLLKCFCICVLMLAIGGGDVLAGSIKKRIRVGGGKAGAAATGAIIGGVIGQNMTHGYDENRTGQGSAQVQPNAIPEKIAVIQPETIGYPPLAGFGSGFAVTRDGYIVTNEHVVEGGTHFLVRDANAGVAYPARVIKVNAQYDIAVLKAEINTIPIPIAQGDLRIGEEIVAFGFPKPQYLGLGLKVVFGQVNAWDLNRSPQDMYQMDAPIYGGNSGGPVVSYSGQVVGIASAGFESLGNVRYAVKPKYIVGFLQDIVGAVPYSPRVTFSKPDLSEQISPSVFQILNYRAR